CAARVKRGVEGNQSSSDGPVFWRRSPYCDRRAGRCSADLARWSYTRFLFQRHGGGDWRLTTNSLAFARDQAPPPTVAQKGMILRLVGFGLLSLATEYAYAQAPGALAPGAPAPTFRITGFLDQIITYSNNTSNFDFDLHRKDYLFYARNRGRFDVIGEYGKAR